MKKQNSKKQLLKSSKKKSNIHACSPLETLYTKNQTPIKKLNFQGAVFESGENRELQPHNATLCG
jgi:hypothetical protein